MMIYLEEQLFSRIILRFICFLLLRNNAKLNIQEKPEKSALLI